MDPKLYCFACMEVLETEDQVCPRCGHDNSIRTNGKGQLPFSIIKNRYLIGKSLGRGGFGVTYMGMDLSLDRPVAIKEYYPIDLVSRESGQSSLAAYDEDTRIRFEQGRERSMQEARMIARLNDVPDTVNVYDVFLANDTLYIVMEFIEGETLRARIKREGAKLQPEAALSLLMPIIEALIEIHRRGIIHRDISPDNIMFRQSSGRAVLLDFGAAHNLQLEAESEHSTSLRPGYAPVEQYSKNGLQDARTDEYALCSTIYYAITGQKPIASMERAFGEATLQPPSALGVDISPAFEAVLMKGLSILAKDRYDDVTALKAAFNKAVGPAPASAPIFTPNHTPTPTPAPAPKRQKTLVLGLTLACIALAAVSFSLWQRGNVPVDLLGSGNPAGQEAGAVTPVLTALPALASTETASPAPAEPSSKPAPTPTSTPNPTEKPSPIPTSAPTLIPTPLFPAVQPKAIPTATPVPAVTVYGKVTDETSEYLGQLIYRSREGWLYLNEGDWSFTLWGIAKDHGLGDVETLALPAKINGTEIWLIAENFSEHCEIDVKDVKKIVSKDSNSILGLDALKQFTSLEALEGSLECLYFSDLPVESPLYQNHYQDILLLDGTTLFHFNVDSKGAAEVPDGVTKILGDSFSTLDEKGNYIEGNFISIRLPNTLKELCSLSLYGFKGEELRIPDGVLLNYRLIGGDTGKETSTLKTIVVGNGIRLGEYVKKEKTVFPRFNGTLYMEDGATMKTLVGLFPEGSQYTLSCQKDAVPASGIPKGVTVKYRK